MATFKCYLCEADESACTLTVDGDSIQPIHCPYEEDNEPEWEEQYDADPMGKNPNG